MAEPTDLFGVAGDSDQLSLFGAGEVLKAA
jgi:hypothetical protein